ncbi:MAG TPA: hypothetical protein VIH10_11750 [Kribbella sp.]|jgi:glycerol-3-phosphate acyltransferase PlsY
MTAANTAHGATESSPVVTSLAPALSDLGQAALGYATAKASQKVDDWADDLKDFATAGGPTTQAVFAGLKAKVGGRNPVWAAIKGGWSGASPKLKLAVVLILTLTLLLGPVVLVVLLLGLVVAALVAGIRAATR